MQSFFVLVLLFFVVGPIVLFFLVLGARNRIDALERSQKEMRDELQRLRGQPAARPVPARAVESPAPAARSEAEAKPATAAITPPASAPAPPPEIVSAPIAKPAPGPASANAPVPVSMPRREITASATEADAPPPYEPSPPPAWLVHLKEWLFGGNLVAKVGLLILFFGVGFLLKYAAARVTVPIEFRLIGITLVDIGLLLWGWRIRASRPAISLPVQGAALAILMLVTFGAFRLYHLIPGGLAFALLFVLTAFTCILAVLQNAVWLAVFGIAGGFAAPILTSTGQGSHIALFSYYALLNAGILAIALKRSWRALNLLGFIFTFLIGTTWGVLRYQPENYASVQGFLILFFVFYVAIAITHAIRQAPRLKNYVDGTLVFGTPLLAFGLQYGIVHDKPFGLAYSALALGLFYIGLSLLMWQRRGSSLKLLVESFLALGIVFGTLAIPFALDGRWTSAAWALEGAGIVWVGLRQRQTLAWVFGVLVQVGAWFSFIGSVSGLTPSVAAQSNLWLGFLLLAGTGMAMAMNFRKRSSEGAADGQGGALALLATLFLAVASVWLLAGAWTEIILHMHGHLRGTLLVFSAVMVAGILGMVARSLEWNVARYFAVLPQIAAGAALAYALFNGDSMQSQGNLFDGPFLGALLIALGAGFSGLMFHRQPETGHRGLSRMLLGWSALWWFALVLPSLAAWGEWMLAAHTTLDAGRSELFHALYNLFLAAGAIAFARLTIRLDWADLRWPAAVVWPGLLIATLDILDTLHGGGLNLPGAPAWAGYIALWLAGEWLLANSQRTAWLLPEERPWTLRVLHTLRTTSPWLILWPLGHHLITRALQAGSAQEAMLLAEAGWYTTGSWARYLPAWAMMAFIGVLITRVLAADEDNDRVDNWPVAPIPEWYRHTLIPLGTLWSLLLVLFWNFAHNGQMAPLPYLPLLNPLDLSTGFAALLGIATWRMHGGAGAEVRPWSSRVLQAAMLLAYLWFNLMLLRTAANYLDIPYRFDRLFQSQFVQAMLSLVWSATALVLMRFAARRAMRTPWMAGAALLALVVAKLFFVDPNVGGIERIVSFLGVGALMLAIGYLAPFPGSAASEGMGTDEKNAAAE
ncbi:MAG TPA: DUF2339 domain-containing protein [Usitatibacteraceae bacterium]